MTAFSGLPSFRHPSLPLRSALAGAAALLAVGCAGIAPGPSPAAEAAIQDLETVRPSLTTAEDSLILDLLVGYRTLAAGGTDRDALRRAHAAQTRLEYLLRHGGVSAPGGEARVVTLPDGQRLTLAEAVDQLSAALLRNVPETAWRPESERAREIRRHRGELSFLVEDAEWVLSLAAALEGSLPETDKRRLRRLHEAYAAEAPHADVAAQVNALLADIRDERMQRELKKLANRSWERERRAGTTGEPAPKPVVPVPVPPVPEDATPAPTAPVTPAPSIPEFLAAPPDAPAAGDTPVIDTADIPAPLTTPPERYCEDRRTAAARAFASARAATDPDARRRFLEQSLEQLDDCLNRHPETEAAEKARRNREMVQRELNAQ